MVSRITSAHAIEVALCSETSVFEPQSYLGALACMIGSMLCWGSWANTKKIVSNYPFQLFYWDYCIGVLGASLLYGLTAGSVRGGDTGFLHSLFQADALHLLLAAAAGIIFNVANLLLVAAIDIAGMAVAFPVGIGLALVIGVVLNYLLDRDGNPFLLFGGLLLVCLAIVVDAAAYRLREQERSATDMRGLRLALLAGVLMGLFYPFVVKATSGRNALGPYSVNFVFSIGLLLCALPFNAWLMRHPLGAEPPVSGQGYRRAGAREHLWGILGGILWSAGAALSFVAAAVHLVGPAVSYAIGQGATMVSALWGVLIWREFAAAPRSARRLIPLMFALFLSGLALIAYAPLAGER